MFEYVHDPKRHLPTVLRRSAVDIPGASQLLMLQRQAGNAATARALHSSFNASPVVLQRALVAGKLNVVGETHTQSDKRRPVEKAFCREITGSGNYWTEAEFPDLHMAVPGRRARAQAQPGRDANADLMEFRAAHAAAMLIGQYERTAQAADLLVASGVNGSGLRTFIDQDFRKLVKYKTRTERAWQATQTPEVNSAVKDVFQSVERIEKAFLAAVSTASKRRQALEFLRDANGPVKQLAAPLAKAVGFPGSTNLAHEMRTARSTMMGLAAEFSGQKGVWKVGDLHIADVLDGSAHTQQVKANYESKDDFNAELVAWARQKRQERAAQNQT